MGEAHSCLRNPEREVNNFKTRRRYGSCDIVIGIFLKTREEWDACVEFSSPRIE